MSEISSPRDALTPNEVNLTAPPAVHQGLAVRSEDQQTELIRQWLCLSALTPDTAGRPVGLETRVHLLPAELRVPVAEALAQRGLTSEALKLLHALLPTSGCARDDVRMAMARICVGMGDYQRASDELRFSAGCSERPLVRAFAAYLEVMAHPGRAAADPGSAGDSGDFENARRWSAQVLAGPDDLTLEREAGDDAEVIALCVQSCLFPGKESHNEPAERLGHLLARARLTRTETGYALLLYARRRLDQGCCGTVEQALDIAWDLLIPRSSVRTNLLSLLPETLYPTSA